MLLKNLITSQLILMLLLGTSAALAQEDNAASEAKRVPDAETTAMQAVAEEDDDDENWDDEDWDDEAGEYDVEIAPEDTYSLDKCISLALQKSHAIKAANWEVKYYDAKADEAWWAWFPKITVQSILTAAPDYDPPSTNNPAAFLSYSQDWYRFDGILWGNDVNLTQPLYTFGKYSSVKEMGKLGAQAGTYGKKVVENKIIYEVKRVYYTLQLVERMLDVLDEGMSYVNTAEKKLNELLESGSDTVTEIDQYKFAVVRADLLSRVEEARKNKRILVQAMRMLLTLPENAPFYLDRRYPKNPDANERFTSSSKLHEAMKGEKPELRLLDLQYKFAEEKLNLQRAWYFPDFFLHLKYKYVTAPEMPNIDSPYLSDPYNSHYFAFFVGLNYTFDLPLQNARVKQAEFKVNKAESEANFMKGKMRLEMEEAHATYEEKYKQFKINETGQKAGKKWMITAMMNYNIGLLESSNMVESIAAYFKTEFTYYSSVHSVWCAEAKLDFLVGGEADKYKTGTDEKPQDGKIE